MEHLRRDVIRPVLDVVVGEAQDEVAGEEERVRGRPVVLEGGARAVRLVAVHLDDQAPVVPDEVDARLGAVLRLWSRDAVLSAETDKRILERRLREGGGPRGSASAALPASV
jgi:hypothetical protein